MEQLLALKLCKTGGGATGQRICCNKYLKCRTYEILFACYLSSVISLSVLHKQEIGKSEHAGSEGKHNIGKTFRTGIKYCLMFMVNVWEANIFVYSMLMYFTTLHINYGNVIETMLT